MKTLTYHEGELLVSESDEPVPGDGQTLIDVIATGICGTDLGAFRHGRPLPRAGVIMGHEILGVVADTGQRVAVNPIVGCGACVACASGSSQRCATRQVIGFHLDGGFARRVVVPTANIVRVPDGVPDRRALFSEPLATALHAWRLGNAATGARIAVIGAGAIGLSLILAARADGFRVEECVELDAERAPLAVEAGARAAGPQLTADAYDIVFDCVGASATRRLAVERLAPGGTCVFVGLADAETTFDIAALVAREKTLRGAFGYSQLDFRDAVRSPVEVPAHWVQQVGLREGVGLTTGAERPRPGVVKVMVSPSDAGGSPALR